jgi:hypothetical protein
MPRRHTGPACVFSTLHSLSLKKNSVLLSMTPWTSHERVPRSKEALLHGWTHTPHIGTLCLCLQGLEAGAAAIRSQEQASPGHE